MSLVVTKDSLKLGSSLGIYPVFYCLLLSDEDLSRPGAGLLPRDGERLLLRGSDLGCPVVGSEAVLSAWGEICMQVDQGPSVTSVHWSRGQWLNTSNVSLVASIIKLVVLHSGRLAVH